MRTAALPQLLACTRMWFGLLGRHRPIIHVHDPVVYRMMRPALLASRARVVVHFQIEPSEEQILWTLKFPPDHVVACAKYIARTIGRVLEQRAISVPITAVPNAVDVEAFSPGQAVLARSHVGSPTQRFVVLLLANLAPHKGQITAIKATRELKTRGIPVECWLVGEDRSGTGSFEAQLRELCSKLAVDDAVRFLGFRSDVADLLRASDVFVLPSTHEGLPLSLLEAQASHVPVIGSPIPGILEVVTDGHTGFIVPADDHMGYADRIQTLFERPDLRREISQGAAAQVARDYGWAALESRIFQIYGSLGLTLMGAEAGTSP